MLERRELGSRRLPRDAPIPRRLVEQTISLGADFVADPASIGVAIHGDLHFENVLAADREPWLVIDPKPMSGDPHYEVSPLLWNRWDEIVEAGDVRRAVKRRFHAVVDVAGLDEGRARDFLYQNRDNVARAIKSHLYAQGVPASGYLDLVRGDFDPVGRPARWAHAGR